MFKSNTQFKQGTVQQWGKTKLPSISSLAINLKPMQTAIINCNKEFDVLVNLPTGYGKSMLFQYQALLQKDKSILVVVPLKALLWDSIHQAFKLNITAAQLNPDKMNQFDLTNPPKLLFVTPQRLFKTYSAYEAVVNLVNNNKISLFVIDEVHCMSQWGSDFRPDYARLSSLRQDFPQIRILAMSATAPPRIRNQIITKLKLKNCYFFFISYNRPNLIYQVMKTTKSNLSTNIISLVNKQFKGQSGIIYCQTIKLCAKLHSQLNTSFNCQMFHSKVSESRRQRILENFKNLKGRIIIATICFGMGINKTDVRFVIHAGMPFSIENYYQQSGRAGRDGKPARCILLNYYGQQEPLRFLIQRTRATCNTSKKAFSQKNSQIDSMMSYVNNKKQCRKRFMFKELGQNFVDCNKTCDICLGTDKTQQFDFTEKGTKILNCMKQSNIKVTVIQLKDVLKGKNKNFDSLKPILGLLKISKQQQILQIIEQLANQGYLKQFIKKNKFGMTKKLMINRNKHYNKILIQKSISNANNMQKRTSNLMSYINKKKQIQIQDVKETKQNMIQDMKQAVYYDTMSSYDDMVVQSYENFCGEAEPDLNLSISKYDDDQLENLDDFEIDDHDIKVIFPNADLQVSDPCQSFTGQCLFPKNNNQTKQQTSKNLINKINPSKQQIKQQSKQQPNFKPCQKVLSLYTKYGIQPDKQKNILSLKRTISQAEFTKRQSIQKKQIKKFKFI